MLTRIELSFKCVSNVAFVPEACTARIMGRMWTVYKRALFEKVTVTLDSIICTEFLGDGGGRASSERLLKDH